LQHRGEFVIHGIEYDVPAPIEFYDAVHAEALRRVGPYVEGLLLHVARPSERGFRVLEVWESAEQRKRYDDEAIGPIMAALIGDGPPPEGPPAGEEFEIRGLVLPREGIAL
jgi:hypothetical protein